MRILVLSPHPKEIVDIVRHAGPDYVRWTDAPVSGLDFYDCNFAISFRYRHIIRDPNVFRLTHDNIINLHIAALPHNRGADPVFWALHDGTPMGVTIHVMTAGVDCGPILAQKILDSEIQREDWRDADAVQRVKDYHYVRMVDLFREWWPAIRSGKAPQMPQDGPSSYHYVRDRIDLLSRS